MTVFQIAMYSIGITVTLITVFCVMSLLLLLIGEYIQKLIGGIKWFGRKMNELRAENKELKSQIKELEAMRNYEDHLEHGDDPNPGRIY